MRNSQNNVRTLGNSFVGQVVAVVVGHETTRTITARILLALLPIAERLGLSGFASLACRPVPAFAGTGDAVGSKARRGMSYQGMSGQVCWQRHSSRLCRPPVA